jgi:hypothetical protein
MRADGRDVRQGRTSVAVELKPGARFRSAVGETEVVVINPPAGAVDLRCGGHPVVPIGDEPPTGLTAESGFDEGSQIGKRYVDGADELELLCSKGGTASLSIGAELLVLKDAKPLPSSD